MNGLEVEELGSLDADHTDMPPAEAIQLASHIWAIDGNATRLSTEKDDTFRLDTDSGSRYVLKISNPSERLAEVDLECRITEHVLASRTDVPVPHLVPSIDGSIIVPVRDEAGQERLARVMTFLDGTPLDSAGSSSTEREFVGEALAKLRLATADFSHPADGRTCAWDISHLPALTPLFENLNEYEQREDLLRAAFTRYMDRVAAHIPQLRRQMVHNDFSKSNILVDHAEPGFVSGIVDFGDAVRTAIAIDVSTALLNQLPRDVAASPVEDLFADGRDVLRGYSRIADLTPTELTLLPHLVMGRIIARALISHFLAERMPANREYVLRNTEQGWGQLEWFMQRSPQEISLSF